MKIQMDVYTKLSMEMQINCASEFCYSYRVFMFEYLIRYVG